jgi:hypothetical protein
MLMFAGAQSAPQPVPLRAHLPCRHSCPVPGVQGCGSGRRLHRAPGIQQPTTHAAAYQQQLRSIRATGRSHLRGAAAAAAARAGLKLIVIPGAALRVVELAFTAAGRWALGAGRWALGAGRWALGAGLWALGAGRWALGAGRWALGAGRHSVSPQAPLPRQLTTASPRCLAALQVPGTPHAPGSAAQGCAASPEAHAAASGQPGGTALRLRAGASSRWCCCRCCCGRKVIALFQLGYSPSQATAASLQLLHGPGMAWRGAQTHAQPLRGPLHGPWQPGVSCTLGALQASGDGSDNTFQGMSGDCAGTGGTDSRGGSPPPQVLLLPETTVEVTHLRK